MGSWTLDHNRYLSLLLDDVTGTEDIVKIRQDLCKIHDCIELVCDKTINKNFTGSKSEGLQLPGSDVDLMYDMNNLYDIEVSESADELIHSRHERRFLMIKNTFRFCIFEVYESRTGPRITSCIVNIW